MTDIGAVIPGRAAVHFLYWYGRPGWEYCLRYAAGGVRLTHNGLGTTRSVQVWARDVGVASSGQHASSSIDYSVYSKIVH